MGGRRTESPTRNKSEITREDTTTRKVMPAVPGLCKVNWDQATMLGSPIGNDMSIQNAIWAKSKSLDILGNELQYLHSHDTFCLLHHFLTIPKVLHILHSSPCFLSPDNLLRSLLGTILNINITNLAYTQASLPIWMGDLEYEASPCLHLPPFWPLLRVPLIWSPRSSQGGCTIPRAQWQASGAQRSTSIRPGHFPSEGLGPSQGDKCSCSPVKDNPR